MNRSINRINKQADNYVEMKELSGLDELKKLVFGLEGKMKTIQDLKDRAMHGAKVLTQVIEFNQEFEKLKGLLVELKRYETGNSKQQQIQTKALSNVENFIRNLHPEEVEHRLETMRDEIQERSRHSQAQLTGGQQQSQLQNQSYIRQLEADRKELIELDKLMEILKNMAKESENLLMGQGQQLRAAADKIGKAARNMGVAKGEMIEAREYTADSSRLTCYCFILVAAIVIIILLITYASYKK